jgi:hypothetical protein
VKYIAEIHNAREICLVGAADLQFWQARLAADELSPANMGGQAELWLTAVQLKWLGITFQELSVAVRLDPIAASPPSVYLVSAFNTSRVFAWCERKCFQTPYQHAHVAVHAEQPWSFDLCHDKTVTLAAQSGAVASLTMVDETWTGTIFLPATGAHSGHKFFHAQLSGLVEVAPFDRSSARLDLRPSSHHPVVQLLADSRFTGSEWRVRTNATHARSKTYAASKPSVVL